MSEITASEQIRLDIIKKVNYDTAAAKLAIDWVGDSGNDSNLLIVFYVQIMPDDFVMQLHR
ncbi:DUF2560 family protein, partial [Klebsiella pneumoniae]|nr:DUF2560 family protein [Klebsiella pneumoniae]MCP6172480.1 DUF2560 family protein [Klebsiella pneumoniae]